MTDGSAAVRSRCAGYRLVSPRIAEGYWRTALPEVPGSVGARETATSAFESSGGRRCPTPPGLAGPSRRWSRRLLYGAGRRAGVLRGTETAPRLRVPRRRRIESNPHPVTDPFTRSIASLACDFVVGCRPPLRGVRCGRAWLDLLDGGLYGRDRVRPGQRAPRGRRWPRMRRTRPWLVPGRGSGGTGGLALCRSKAEALSSAWSSPRLVRQVGTVRLLRNGGGRTGWALEPGPLPSPGCP